MTSSDERREVAARLRENANKHGAVLDYLGGAQVASWWLLLHTIGCDSNEQEVAFNMLADLIDPTCHNASHVEPQLKTAGPFVCSHCGCWASERWVMDDFESRHTTPISYCPNCGARVVDE